MMGITVFNMAPGEAVCGKMANAYARKDGFIPRSNVYAGLGCLFVLEALANSWRTVRELWNSSAIHCVSLEEAAPQR